MGYTTCIVTALLLAGSSTADAENWNPEPAVPDVEREEHWRIVTPDMSPHEFREATRNNQRLVGDTLKTYSENVFTSIGLSKKNINYVGAAIGLAVQDARFHLDDKKMLALEIKDITDGDRAVFVGINMDW